MILLLEASIIQVIALCVFAGTLFSLYLLRKSSSPGLAKWFGLMMLFVLPSIFLWNALIDPYGWLNTGLIRPIAVQDRWEKVQLYEALPAPPQVLIVGSSRTMMLDPTRIEQTCNLTAFNASVSNAKMEDYLSIINYTRQENPPTSLIIGLDITAFEPVPEYGRQAVLTPLYPSLDLSLAQRLKQTWQVLIQYLSAEMTLKSYESLKLEITDSRPPDLYTFTTTGQVTYTPYDRQIAAGTFVPLLEVAPNTQFPPYFKTLDKKRVHALEMILQQAVRDETRVYIFLPPFYPAYLDALKKDATFNARYADTLALLKRLEQVYEFTWYDFTDIKSFHGDAGLFYDVIHYRPENAERLLDRILRDMCHGL